MKHLFLFLTESSAATIALPFQQEKHIDFFGKTRKFWKRFYSCRPHNRKKTAMVGVSLTIALFLVLERKSSLLKCFAVLLLGFFSVTRNSHAEILPVFPGEILPLQGKRLEQNRIMSYEAPPNAPVFCCLRGKNDTKRAESEFARRTKCSHMAKQTVKKD